MHSADTTSVRARIEPVSSAADETRTAGETTAVDGPIPRALEVSDG